jgi:hypothetical protein
MGQNDKSVAMIVECPFCESKVDAKVLAQHVEYGQDEEDLGDLPFRVSLLVCPVCKRTLLGGEDEYGQDNWSESLRLWPDPEVSPHQDLPDVVSDSLIEAKKCYKATAYGACAVMCGRVLEAISTEFKTKAKALAGGLKELLDQGVIDKKIFAWGEALRKHRNIGAHASTEKISKEDAKDLLDFATAICDYVFVLTKKFEAFMERKHKTGVEEGEGRQ